MVISGYWILTSAHRIRIVPLLASSVWFFTEVSWAQQRDPAAARVLFQDARKAADADDYATACPKFADSYKLDPAVGTLLNIADCQQRSGQLATAWVNFQKALELLHSDDDRRPIVEKMTTELEKRVPRLGLRLAASAPKEAAVERDGTPVGYTSYGVALPIDPGHHVIVVKAPGHVERRYEIDLTEGELKEVVAEVGIVQPPAALPAVAPQNLPAVQPSKSPFITRETSPTSDRIVHEKQPSQPQVEYRSRTAAYVIGGIGATGLTAALVTRILAFGQKATITEHCGSDKLCDTTGMDAVSRARAYQTVSTALLLVGAAGLGVGIYLRAAESEQPAFQATLHPIVLPNGAGLSLHRNF